MGLEGDPNSDEFSTLADLVLLGRASEKEKARLAEILNADAGRRSEFFRLRELCRLLPLALEEDERGARFMRSFRTRASAKADSETFLSAARDRIASAISRARRRRVLVAAAALIIAAAGGILWTVRFERPPAVARVEGVNGEVIHLPDRRPVTVGQELVSGQGVETLGSASNAALVYPDGTRLDLGGNAFLPRIEDAKVGKRVSIARGTLQARVSAQPAGRPMVFSTPHGEARVLGTTLQIVVDLDPKKGTMLDVNQGTVQLRNLAGKTVDVESGHYAVAAVGVEFVVKPSSTPLPTLAKLRPNTWVELSASYAVPPNLGNHTPRGWTKAIYDSVAGRILVVDRWTDPVRMDTSYANAVIEFFPATGRASLVKISNWRKEATPTGVRTVPMPENGSEPTPCDRMPHGGVAFVPFQNALYLTNGANQSAPDDRGSARDTWRIDLGTRRWTRVASTLQPPNELEDCMTYDEGEGKLIYFAHAAANQPETWVMDPTKGQWIQMELATQPPGRMGGAMAYDPVRKRSLLFGGGTYPKPGRDLWAYDARANAWTRLADAPRETKNAGFAYDSRHEIFLASFQEGPGPDRTLVYRPALNAWSEVLPPAGEKWPEWSGTSQALAFDPTSDVFVFLGGGPEGPRWFVFRYVP